MPLVLGFALACVIRPAPEGCRCELPEHPCRTGETCQGGVCIKADGVSACGETLHSSCVDAGVGFTWSQCQHGFSSEEPAGLYGGQLVVSPGNRRVWASVEAVTPGFGGPAGIETELERALLPGDAGVGTLRGSLRIEAMPNGLVTFAGIRVIHPTLGPVAMVEGFLHAVDAGFVQLHMYCGEAYFGSNQQEMLRAPLVELNTTYELQLSWARGRYCHLNVNGVTTFYRRYTGTPMLKAPVIEQFRLGVVDYDPSPFGANSKVTLALENWRFAPFSNP